MNFATTKRYFNSSIPTLQRVLNHHELKKIFLKEGLVFDAPMSPVNYVSYFDSLSLWSCILYYYNIILYLISYPQTTLYKLLPSEHTISVDINPIECILNIVSQFYSWHLHFWSRRTDHTHICSWGNIRKNIPLRSFVYVLQNQNIKKWYIVIKSCLWVLW